MLETIPKRVSGSSIVIIVTHSPHAFTLNDTVGIQRFYLNLWKSEPKLITKRLTLGFSPSFIIKNAFP